MINERHMCALTNYYGFFATRVIRSLFSGSRCFGTRETLFRNTILCNRRGGGGIVYVCVWGGEVYYLTEQCGRIFNSC